jgi:Zn finger protein HypA/HybF involved in hydrogenase expression
MTRQQYIMVEGYCAKCKNRKAIADGVEETMKNGRVVYKGKCESCGTEMLKIIGENGDGAEAKETDPKREG